MLLAPDLLPVEVANVLWKKARRGEMTPAQVEQGITDLAAASLVLLATQPLLIRATRLAIELQHPVYDCLYLVVAAEWSAQLATLDARLRTLGEGLGLRVWRA